MSAQAPTCPCCGRALRKRTTSTWLRRGQRYSGNHQVVSQREGHADTVHLHLWDGESYGDPRYLPFCTIRCGLTFGQAAHKVGYRYTSNRRSK